MIAEYKWKREMMIKPIRGDDPLTRIYYRIIDSQIERIDHKIDLILDQTLLSYLVRH